MLVKGIRASPRQNAHLRAWQDLIRLQTSLSSVFVILVPVYSQGWGLKCLVAMQHLRFPTLADGSRLQPRAELLAWVWMWCSLDARTRWEVGLRRSRWSQRARAVEAPITQVADEERSGVASGTAWNLWLVACSVASAPAAIYSSIRAIPGFV
eukprot:4963217-Amphidinium_carterae.1